MRKSIAIATIGAALALLHPIFGSTSAMFSGTFAQQTNQFAGATFSPTVAPVVSVTSHPNSISLSWTDVTISSGRAITYSVVRTDANGVAVAVCTGADVPTTAGTTMSCTDKSVTTGVAYSYTEQPIVYAGTVATWSLTPSLASSSVCSKKCK